MLRPRSTRSVSVSALTRVGADETFIEKAAYWGPYGSKEGAIKAAREAILSVVPTANDNQIDIVAAIGLMENQYGVTPSWRLPDGTPTYNWGALRAQAGDERFYHGDHDAEGNAGQYAFAVFPSMSAGLARFLSIFGTEALAAAAGGDATRVAAVMYRRGYFTGIAGTNEERILAYAKAVESTARVIAGTFGRGSKVLLGEVPVDWRVGGKASYPGDKKPLSATAIAGGVGLLAGLAAGAGAVWYFFLRKVSV